MPLKQVRAAVETGTTMRELEARETRRYHDGDGVFPNGWEEPKCMVDKFVARGGFGDVYSVTRDGQTFAMKTIRLEGKTRDDKVSALRSLVLETHFALRVRARWVF